jgi:hypothetical protein
MKPSALRIERLLAKVEAELACSAHARRYVFHYDEVAEAEAQRLALRARTQGFEQAGPATSDLCSGSRGGLGQVRDLMNADQPGGRAPNDLTVNAVSLR